MVVTEEAKDGEIRITLFDRTIDQVVIAVLHHETEADGTTDHLAAVLMACAMMTAPEALCHTSMGTLGRGDTTTANVSSTTGAISASVATLIHKSGSTNLLRRSSTKLLKGAAMRLSRRANASELQFTVSAMN